MKLPFVYLVWILLLSTYICVNWFLEELKGIGAIRAIPVAVRFTIC